MITFTSDVTKSLKKDKEFGCEEIVDVMKNSQNSNNYQEKREWILTQNDQIPITISQKSDEKGTIVKKKTNGMKIFLYLTMICTITVIYMMLFDKDMKKPIYLSHNEVAIAGQNQSITTSPNCRCVDCEEDKVCGGLWKGNSYPPKDNNNDPDNYIHIVISHCKNDLDWVSNFTRGYEDNIASIHVVTKCDHPVKGAPDEATVQNLPNVGRCDHTYAYYITTLLDEEMKKHGTSAEDSIVIFLKDDISDENNFYIPTKSFSTLVELASSTNGFGCYRAPYTDIVADDEDESYYDCSTYHLSPYLMNYTMEDYVRNEKGYESDDTNFSSGRYPNLGAFYSYLNIDPLPELIQVCYGGVFSASVENIKKIDEDEWRKAEKELSRGNNIQEGHYMERLWATLLSKPLEPHQLNTLKKIIADENFMDILPYLGMVCLHPNDTETNLH